MEAQNYKNHRRYVPGYHIVLALILLLTFIGSIVNLARCWGNHQTLYSASLIVVLTFCGGMFFVYARQFALRAQDRAIRAEENLRHFAMTGKPLDSRLTMRQIIGLRFASDEEFLALAKRAVDENLSEDDVKKAVRNWRADYHRA